MKYFTDTEKADFGTVLDDLHETFAQNVVFYRERNILTISSDTNFNYVYQDSQAGVTSTTQVHSGLLDARISYLSPGKQDFPLPDFNIDNSKTYVRIRTKLSNLSVLDEIKELHLDGLKYEVASAPKPHSLFPNTTKYVDVIFSSIK